jgi:hypothetical protein
LNLEDVTASFYSGSDDLLDDLFLLKIDVFNNFRAWPSWPYRTPLILFSSGKTAFFKARVIDLSCNLFQSSRMRCAVLLLLSLLVVVVVVVVVVVTVVRSFYGIHTRLFSVGSRFVSRPRSRF